MIINGYHTGKKSMPKVKQLNSLTEIPDCERIGAKTQHQRRRPVVLRIPYLV